MREKRNSYRVLVGKAGGKRPLGRPRRSWENNVKNLEKQGGVVWTEFIWFRIGIRGGLL
jgi:hypothetical protein